MTTADKSNSPPDKPARDIVYACSGCSDVGEAADRIARRIRDDGLADMGCLAGIGGRVKPLMQKAEKARRIVVVDGCPLECASQTLRGAGFKEIIPIKLHALGLRKGSCPATDEHLQGGIDAVKEVLKSDPAQ